MFTTFFYVDLSLHMLREHDSVSIAGENSKWRMYFQTMFPRFFHSLSQGQSQFISFV